VDSLSLWDANDKEPSQEVRRTHDRVCKQCGKEFRARYPASGACYCSRACFAQSQQVRVNCRTCGKSFRRDCADQVYCSKACYGVSRRKPGSSPLVRLNTCLSCGAPVPKTGTKYCSRSCAARGRVQYDDAARERQCAHCGRTFLVAQYHWQRRFCSRICASAASVYLPLLKKKCLMCGKEFQTKKARRKYCSQDCKKAHQRVRWEELSPDERAIAVRRLQGITEFTSNIEHVLHDALVQWRVEFQTQVLIGQYYVDIYVPSQNLVIEVFGCYWHRCPTCGFHDAERWEYDGHRLARISEAGYRVAIVWEHDIRRNAEEALQAAFRAISELP